MRVVVKNGVKKLQPGKAELKKLQAAIDVVDSLRQCGEEVDELLAGMKTLVDRLTPDQS